MTKISVILKLFLLIHVFHCSVPLQAQKATDEILRVESNLVNVYFSILDKENKFLTTIQREDIELYEDDVRQEIQTFQHEIDLPLYIAVLMDMSGSQKNNLDQEKAATRSFVNTIVRKHMDQVAIISFAADPFLEQTFTNDITRAGTAIDRMSTIKGALGYQGAGTILPAGSKAARGMLSYSSAIWDALWITTRHLMSTAPMNTRKVLVIVTDGEDTSSRANLEEAINEAVQTDTAVYVIGLGDSSIAEGVNKDTLKKLSSGTGGQFFAPKKKEDLDSAFAKIERELRSQYLVTYIPKNKNAQPPFRQIRVAVGQPYLRRQKLRLIHRPGYYYSK